jgi:hypothetical protein
MFTIQPAESPGPRTSALCLEVISKESGEALYIASIWLKDPLKAVQTHENYAALSILFPSM